MRVTTSPDDADPIRSNPDEQNYLEIKDIGLAEFADGDWIEFRAIPNGTIKIGSETLRKWIYLSKPKEKAR